MSEVPLCSQHTARCGCRSVGAVSPYPHTFRGRENVWRAEDRERERERKRERRRGGSCDSGFGVQALQSQLWFRQTRRGLWVSGLGFWVSGSGFRVSSFGSQASGFGFRVSGFGCRVSGFGFPGSGSTVTAAAAPSAALALATAAAAAAIASGVTPSPDNPAMKRVMDPCRGVRGLGTRWSHGLGIGAIGPVDWGATVT